MEIVKIFLSPAVTIIVGVLAYIIYIMQKRDYKRNVAKSILQEIRWAENLINKYKENKKYKFTQKIISTNSWTQNMHLFVGDLSPDEIDKISDLYSMGEYLDTIINKISDVKFYKNVEKFYKFLESQPAVIPITKINRDNLKIEGKPTYQKIIAPWQYLLDEISLRYEPIYHTTIMLKLKKIAKVK